MLEESSFTKLILQDIVNPPNCAVGIAPAKAYVDLALEENATRDIQLWLKQILANFGELSLDEVSFSLVLDSDNGFDLLHERLERLPESAIWGQVVWTEQADQETANQFLAELEALTDDLGLTDGFYGYFEASEEGQTLSLTGYGAEESVAIQQQQTIAFNHNGAQDDIQTLVNSFRTQYPDQLRIVLQDGNGRSY